MAGTSAQNEPSAGAMPKNNASAATGMIATIAGRMTASSALSQPLVPGWMRLRAIDHRVDARKH